MPNVGCLCTCAKGVSVGKGGGIEQGNSWRLCFQDVARKFQVPSSKLLEGRAMQNKICEDFDNAEKVCYRTMARVNGPD